LHGTLTFLALCALASGQRARDVGWPVYGSDKASSKYSPLDQIHARNVGQLRIAWQWTSPDVKLVKQDPSLYSGKFEATPVMANGVLYISTSLNQVVAIDAATGHTIWVYDPASWRLKSLTVPRSVHRGVTYWTDGKQERIFAGTIDAYLIALDAKSGKPIPSFGVEGRIDLTSGLRRPIDRKLYGVNSPPVICRDVIVVGSSVYDYPISGEMPPGDVRGFDARTGKLLWTFHTIPQPDEVGNSTWREESWKRLGAANAWTMLSADEQLGLVYIPLSTPANDHYGGHRPGDNLFAESLVCLNARTGKRVWHFQTTHHGLWDYDLPAAPILADIRVAGRSIPAIVQVTKQAFCFVFDRRTGEPVWPITEKPVPQSNVPGEHAAPTQPFPTKPSPFDRQGLSVEDLIDFTPELRKEAEEILRKFPHGPMYTPPRIGPSATLPGALGGASWAGAAFDPVTKILYVPSVTIPFNFPLSEPGPKSSERFVAERLARHAVRGPRGLPLTKPPYGRVTAINLNNGEHKWMTPLGEGPRSHPALQNLALPRLGWEARGFPLLTKTLLFIAQEGIQRTRAGAEEPTLAELESRDPSVQAFDKETGRLIASIPLPNNAYGSPMTYSAGGKQYIVVAVGGANLLPQLIALTLR